MSERSIRLFCEQPLATGGELALDPGQAHYLRAVMRCRTGDAVRLFNARDGEWRAVLTVDKRRVVAAVGEQLRAPVAVRGPVLWIAPLKRQRFELVVEKATELGIAALQPVTTAHGVVERVNAARLGAIAREAAEQSERSSVPELRPLVPLADALAARDPAPPLYVALARTAAPPLDDAVRAHGAGDLLIGPEGGFSDAEKVRLAAAPGAVVVALGPRILRAETAAIVGLGVLALRMSD